MTNILNFSDFQFDSEQNNEQKAQDIVYDAWDSDSSAQRKRLAKKALELDPNCVDAYCILATEYTSYKKKNEYYKKGIEVFRKNMGRSIFQKIVDISGEYLKQGRLCGFRQDMDNYYGIMRKRMKQYKYMKSYYN